MVTPSTALTTRLILWPPTSLSQTVPPPRSKWTLRLRMARSSLPLPRSSGGGIVAACCRLAGCGLIRRFRSAPVEFELSFFDARVRHVRGKSLHKRIMVFWPVRSLTDYRAGSKAKQAFWMRRGCRDRICGDGRVFLGRLHLSPPGAVARRCRKMPFRLG